MWTLALAIALLWPGRVSSPFDGVPLNGQAEAVLLGLVVPVLWCLHRGFLRRPLAQTLIVALLALKIAAWLTLPQHGLCARFSTSAPIGGTVSTIRIDEPAGILRSWDLRADWRGAAPRCTAILDRPYRSRSEFPAWFLNLLNAVRPDGHGLSLDVAGQLAVDHEGTFVLETGEDMTLAGEIGGARVTAAAGAPIAVALAAGSHPIRLHASLRGEGWRLVPLWNGRDAWAVTRLTSSSSTRLDAAASRLVALATTTMVLALVAGWLFASVRDLRLSRATIVWGITASVVLLTAGATGRFERLVPLLLMAAVLVPVATRERNARTALVMIGLPWLALFAGRAWPEAGRVTIYSLGDDWHMYQSAAYRIFLNGYWIEGGSPTFYFQPLYRWIAGALHVLFGDSSVGETYWDAACLLTAALTGFAIVKRLSGFSWGLVTAALTLSTFTITPAWYLIGRGLSEISALGWMSMATICLMRARLGRASAALAAGGFAVLMWYTRLNLLFVAAALLAWLLPVRTASRWQDVRRALRHVRTGPALMYGATIAAGVVLFAFRTWWYAGRFSVLYGTSFDVQHTGLRLTTIGSPAVWAAIAESVGAQLWMREPPAIDPRAALVVAGALLSLLSLLQVPYINRLPAALAVVTLGGIAGSFVAHAHHYPGRMSVHVVPFAVAMSVCTLARLVTALRTVRSADAASCVAT